MTNPPLQKDRIYTLVLGNLQTGYGLEIKGLQISFQIKKSASTKDCPDRCRIKIHNLSTESLSHFENEYLAAELKVGYKETGLYSLFSGNITYIHTEKKGTERITEIDIGSAYVSLHQTDLSEVAPAGSTIEEVIERIRIGMGTIAKGSYTGDAIKKQAVYGYPLSGSPVQLLDELSRAYDLEHRIDNNTLYVNDAKGYIGTSVDAPVISFKTGLIEAPYYTSGDRRRHKKDPAKKEGIEFVCLLNPTIKPGSLVVLEGITDNVKMNGEFKVDSVDFVGDLRGDQWVSKVYCSGKI